MTPDTPAGRAQGLNRNSGDTAEMDRMPGLQSPPDEDDDEPTTRRWWPMVVTFLAIVAVLAVVGWYFGSQYLNSQYFIGPSKDGKNVAIYQGVDADVAGYSLAKEVEDTGVAMNMLPENERSAVKETITADGKDKASSQAAELRDKAKGCEKNPESCGMPPKKTDSDKQGGKDPSKDSKDSQGSDSTNTDTKQQESTRGST